MAALMILEEVLHLPLHPSGQLLGLQHRYVCVAVHDDVGASEEPLLAPMGTFAGFPFFAAEVAEVSSAVTSYNPRRELVYPGEYDR